MNGGAVFRDIIGGVNGRIIMKKSAMFLVCGAFLALAGMQLHAQEAPKEAANEASGKSLGAVADDIKFENALQFYSMGDYRKALQMFNEYLEIYLTGAHRGEALRHVALIHFDRFEYEKSVRAYTAIHEESNNTEEGIEAYYKTGICYQKMGYDTRAQGVFQSIIEQYPYSTYAYLSRIQIDLLKIIEK
jgi:TolA-binding protein